MLTDPVSLSIASFAARVHTCELCATGHESLRSWIVVRRARGGTVQLAACDRCGAAVRRIMAVAGSGSAAGPAQAAARTEAPPITASVELAAIDLVGTPRAELLRGRLQPRELSQYLSAPSCRPRMYQRCVNANAASPGAIAIT